MKRTNLITAATAALGLAFAGCGSTQIITTTTAGTPPAASTDTTTTPTPPPTARIGGTIALTGRSKTMDVTMVKAIHPLPPSEISTPANGTRYVAITYKLTNTGTNAYDDSPDNGAKLLLTDDSQADAIIDAPTTSECNTASSTSIGPPGSHRQAVERAWPEHTHAWRASKARMI
jgi:hypothetical protein